MYFYLDATPTHSYLKMLYKYPQAAFPYAAAHRREPRAAAAHDPEFELIDTGIFDDDRYFDVVDRVREGRAGRHALRITVDNRGPERRALHVLPQLWFRNTWS